MHQSVASLQSTGSSRSSKHTSTTRTKAPLPTVSSVDAVVRNTYAPCSMMPITNSGFRQILAEVGRSNNTADSGRRGGTSSRQVSVSSARALDQPPTQAQAVAAMRGACKRSPPANFQQVVPGVYRCAYPTSLEGAAYLRSLRPKTIIKLANEDLLLSAVWGVLGAPHLPAEYSFRQDATIDSTGPPSQPLHRPFRVRVEGGEMLYDSNTPAPIVPSLVDLSSVTWGMPSNGGRLMRGAVELATAAMYYIADASNYPIVLMCPTGAVETTLVCAAIRKMQYWSLSSTLDEASRFTAGISGPIGQGSTIWSTIETRIFGSQCTAPISANESVSPVFSPPEFLPSEGQLPIKARLPGYVTRIVAPLFPHIPLVLRNITSCDVVPVTENNNNASSAPTDSASPSASGAVGAVATKRVVLPRWLVESCAAYRYFQLQLAATINSEGGLVHMPVKAFGHVDAAVGGWKGGVAAAMRYDPHPPILGPKSTYTKASLAEPEDD